MSNPISTVIRNRLIEAGERFYANDNISEYIEAGELDLLQQEVESKMAEVLSSLVIDTTNDHNTQETAKRVAKMYLREVFAGRYSPQPTITEFPNHRQLDQLYLVGPITVRSACSHHLVPIIGQAWVGVFPGANVVGLSKIPRLAEWILSRPQIQEEATVDFADMIEDLMQPLGLAVVVKARHLCCSWRGVKDNEMEMTTSVVRGNLRESESLRNEFFSLVGMRK